MIGTKEEYEKRLETARDYYWNLTSKDPRWEVETLAAIHNVSVIDLQSAINLLAKNYMSQLRREMEGRRA